MLTLVGGRVKVVGGRIGSYLDYEEAIGVPRRSYTGAVSNNSQLPASGDLGAGKQIGFEAEGIPHFGAGADLFF